MSVPPSRSAKAFLRNPTTSACSSARANNADVDSVSSVPSVKASRACLIRSAARSSGLGGLGALEGTPLWTWVSEG